MSVGQSVLAKLQSAEFVAFEGDIVALGQNSVEARGPLSRVGDFCLIGEESGKGVLAQVVAIDRDRVKLLPLSSLGKVGLDAKVRCLPERAQLAVGDGFAGRAVDGFAQPIDGNGDIVGAVEVQRQQTPGKLDRIVRDNRVRTGIKAIDGLVPIAEGQRVGIFAAAGVGKTTLIESIAQAVQCDHCILCLIGERGREVERLWRITRDGANADRFTLVAATSDESATARVRALDQALALGEYWRAQGKHVVLIVDFITRLAMALREIGLAADEPPSLRSYTPNVFAALPHYVERCGADRKNGAITAVFTVLAETDDVDDPIVETMKSLLDGHIILSRKLADKGHFPPIDIGSSVSRVANQILSKPTQAAAAQLRKAFAEFEDARPMIESGIYRAGSSAEIDRAIAIQPLLTEFLRQDGLDTAPLEQTDAAMARIVEKIR